MVLSVLEYISKICYLVSDYDNVTIIIDRTNLTKVYKMDNVIYKNINCF